MIRGAHVILYSTDAEADRAFLQDLLGLPAVDAGGGWLIMQLPPGEVAVHPAEVSGATELYLVCDDIEETVTELEREGCRVRRTGQRPALGPAGLDRAARRRTARHLRGPPPHGVRPVVTPGRGSPPGRRPPGPAP